MKMFDITGIITAGTALVKLISGFVKAKDVKKSLAELKQKAAALKTETQGLKTLARNSGLALQQIQEHASDADQLRSALSGILLDLHLPTPDLAQAKADLANSDNDIAAPLRGLTVTALPD